MFGNAYRIFKEVIYLILNKVDKEDIKKILFIVENLFLRSINKTTKKKIALTTLENFFNMKTKKYDTSVINILIEVLHFILKHRLGLKDIDIQNIYAVFHIVNRCSSLDRKALIKRVKSDLSTKGRFLISSKIEEYISLCVEYIKNIQEIEKKDDE
jgi:hypothetical protein